MGRSRVLTCLSTQRVPRWRVFSRESAKAPSRTMPTIGTTTHPTGTGLPSGRGGTGLPSGGGTGLPSGGGGAWEVFSSGGDESVSVTVNVASSPTFGSFSHWARTV